MDSNPKKRAMDRLIPESLTRKLRKTDLRSIVHQQPPEPVVATSNSNEGAVINSTSTTPSNQSEGGARKRNVAKAAIKETLRTIVNVTDVFPPLKSVAAGILEIIERYDAVHDVQRGFTKLQKQLEELLAVIRLYQDDVPVNVMNALTGLARAIEEKRTVLEKKLEESVPVRVVSAPADIAFMTETMRDVNYAIQVVMMDISLATHIETSSISNKISDIHSDVYLGKLGCVTGAEFNHEDRQGCMQGTRVLLLAELWGWSMDLSAPHIFWLSGIAGTGKTTARATLQNIFPSLAQAMARTSTGFREQLLKVLQQRGCADPLGMNLADQYKLLILEPAKATFEQYAASTVLAIDALDECDDPVATEKLLNVILTSRPVEYLKIIATSRPEPPIRSAVQSKPHSGLRLHEIEDHIVEADIMMYLTHRLMEIPQLRNEYVNTPWPPQEVTILTKRAGGLFIYVSTICAYIGNYKGSPSECLKKLCSLSTPPTLAIQMKKLAFKPVSLLVSATQPLQVTGYARLLNTSPQLVRAAVQSLHSVIHVPEKDADGEIIPYHVSFPDYLITESRAGSHEWFIKLDSAHSSSADQCFAIMEMELHFGIGGATKIYKNILSVEGNVQTGGVLLNTLSQRMENMSTLKIGLLDAAKFIDKFVEPIAYSPSHIYISALPFCSQNSMVSQWVKKVPSLPVVQLLQGTLDQPLIFELQEHRDLVWSVSFSPDGRYIASGSCDHTVRLWSVETGMPVGQPYEGHTNSVSSVSFSPDGRYIASGSYDHTVHMWSVETGMPVGQPYEEHTNLVSSVSFSPDGRYIASGSYDHTVRMWSVETGMPVGQPYEGHTNSVRSVSFLPDGRYITSGSDDHSVHLWSVETGMSVGQPYEGHTDNHIDFPWNVVAGRQAIQPYRGSFRMVTALFIV
ncbi:hypothetical protein M422DRAFT_249517 [Sphaerobolus stellatus SS14]|uniref:Nephrocystin 3-like N-terminal domain-containing protein n=1 Tax=Sphaerobolus stellatus (strain SS14) TaxID=990650 RepID=A0A0C9W501_SPHS4|nr:hypothetical protein M422DRAFT_249517 [Sphaerobolus stellatus SS14]